MVVFQEMANYADCKIRFDFSQVIFAVEWVFVEQTTKFKTLQNIVALRVLIYSGRDKMSDILQTAFSNVFS